MGASGEVGTYTRRVPLVTVVRMEVEQMSQSMKPSWMIQKVIRTRLYHGWCFCDAIVTVTGRRAGAEHVCYAVI